LPEVCQCSNNRRHSLLVVSPGDNIHDHLNHFAPFYMPLNTSVINVIGAKPNVKPPSLEQIILYQLYVNAEKDDIESYCIGQVKWGMCMQAITPSLPENSTLPIHTDVLNLSSQQAPRRYYLPT